VNESINASTDTEAPSTRYNLFSNRLYSPVWQPCWTNSCSFNTVVKPVVKPAWQPVWQPVGCLFTRYSRLWDRLYNRFDNRLYRVNGVWEILRSTYFVGLSVVNIRPVSSTRRQNEVKNSVLCFFQHSLLSLLVFVSIIRNLHFVYVYVHTKVYASVYHAW